MNILHVANNAAPRFGGAYRSIGLFRSAGERRGNATHCISFDDNPATNPHFHDEGWTVVPTIRGTLGTNYALISGRTAETLNRVTESADIFVVHLLYRYHAVWAAQRARQLGKPLVIVPHGSLDPYVFTYRALRKRLWLRVFKNLLFRGSLVLYATDREREKAALALPQVNSMSLYWPVDEDTCKLADTLQRSPSTPRRLLLVGRLHPMKRVLETVRAFRALNDPGWQLVVIGAESREIPVDKLRMAAGADWNRSVVYRGLIDRQSLYAEYRSASALILASHRENFGHVVAEAMCFGLPVIISEDVDLQKVVSSAGAGLVVPVQAEEDIVDVLARFFRLTSDELEQYGHSARLAAKQYFDFETFVQTYCTRLEALLSQRAAHSDAEDLQLA